MSRAGTDAAASLLDAWAGRVRANRAQVDRFREVHDGDFYAPVSALFVADPRRTSEPALELIRGMVRADETWLDIGAGAGRYALPIAHAAQRVIAVEPSATMRGALRLGIAEHGAKNVTIVGASWPEALAELGEPPVADVSMIAHVGYDIEEIGPFIDAMERATGRLCVAMLTDRSPASVADPFWPIVHGEQRVPLPALPELLALLEAMGRSPDLIRVDRAPRTFESVDALTGFLRRQLWILENGEKDIRFRAHLAGRIVERDGGWTLIDPPTGSIGIATWQPRTGVPIP
jgi:SAM-dependent methyltransferase